eukprot:1710066-Pleurochrysis_carterae.AAC.1
MAELKDVYGWYAKAPDEEPLALLTLPGARIMPRGAVPKPGGGAPSGISKQRAPRQELRTLPSGELVVALNEAAGPMKPADGDRNPKWHREIKPTLEDATASGMILAFAAALLRLTVIVLAFDFAKFFHQLVYRTSEIWKTMFLVPRHAGVDVQGAGAEPILQVLGELVEAMGAAPSSNVAQDLANALMLRLLSDLDVLEETRVLRLEADNAEFARWMRTRRIMAPDA